MTDHDEYCLKCGHHLDLHGGLLTDGKTSVGQFCPECDKNCYEVERK